MAFSLTSLAFLDGEPIPRRYTCDGEDVSPPLAWSGVPPGTKSLALVCDDPDAPLGTWTHWVLYGLPPEADHLPGHLPTHGLLEDGTRQGLNDFGNVGYGGPCPPRGTHRYVFALYALDAEPPRAPGATVTALRTAVEGHVLASARLTGTYGR
jgi:Raf kinase inhibitor-like YbhB/YbcL family protein